MSKTLIIGLGRQGARICQLLIDKGFESISLCDTQSETLHVLKDQHGPKVALIEKNLFNISDEERIVFLKQFDFIVDALPSFLSFELLTSAARAGSKVVSISFLEEDFMKLDPIAKENGALIIPDCGAAPGLSHLLAGYAVNKLGGATSVVMKLGAIPLQPTPPFFHNLTWSVTDFVEEYTRPAKMRRDGKLITVDPFCEIKQENIEGFDLQSFPTDGVRSFLSSFPNVPNVEERTLRYPGHLDYMKNLKKSNRLWAKEIEKQFGHLSLEDIFIMDIIIKNIHTRPDRQIVHRYIMQFDSENSISGLVDSVAITASETLNLIRYGCIKETGVYPLELLATENVYKAIVGAHRKLGAVCFEMDFKVVAEVEETKCGN